MKQSKHQRRSKIMDQHSTSPVTPGSSPDPESKKASLADMYSRLNSNDDDSSEVNEQHENKQKGDNNSDEWPSVSWP